MTNPPGSPQTAVWRVSACPFSVEYDTDVLHRIAAEAVDGYRSFPHGGVEIGGLLLGEYADGRLRIRGSETVECEHASGPSFLLSRRDEAALLARIQKRSDVVGWYHSHTRSGIHFSADDLAVHQRLFPGAAQIALVLYPNAGSEVRACVFFREANSRVIRNSELVHEFSVGMASPPSPTAAPPARKITQRKTNSRNRVWAGLAAMLALAIAAVVFLRLHSTLGGQPSAGFIRIEALGHDDKVDVRWDPKSLGAVRRAKLYIRDGVLQSDLPLDAKTISAGVATYVRHSEVTSIHIRVERADGAALEGSTTLVAPLATAAQSPPKAAEIAVVGESAGTAAQNIDPTRQTTPPAPAAVFQTPHGVSPQMSPSAILDPPSPASVQEHRSPGVPVSTLALPSPPPKQPAPPLQSALTGRWEFHSGSASRSPAAPEAITVSFSEDNGQVQGTLDARYKDAHAKTEHVQFSFAGKTSGGAARFPWKSSEGVRGEIEFISVPNSPDTIEVVWFDSDAKRIFDDVLKRMN